jgi:uncharacterized membrane protein
MAQPPEDPFDATWRERLVVLGSMFGALAVAIVLGLVFARGATLELFGLVPASFFAVGKFLPLWGITGKSQFGPYELGLVIWVMDTFNVVLFVYALEGLYKIKRLERWLHRVQANSALVLDAYPRMRKMSRVGLVLFVLFPIAGTGSIGATFIGILLRTPRRVLIACVSLGGLIGGMLMAFAAANFSDALRSFQGLQSDPTLKYVFLGVVIALVVAGVWAMNRAYKKVLARQRELVTPASQEPPGSVAT